MASDYILVVGTLIGVFTWIGMAFRLPMIPLGRTLFTFAGALLMLVFGVIDSHEAFESISLETLALLFGTMILSILLEREGFFDKLIGLLTWRCSSAVSLLARLCVMSGLLSALLTNDTVCVFMTPVVVSLCERYELKHGPFLIALATSANIGSTATPVGNPQNMIIASLSGIGYGEFVARIGLAMVIVLVINIACLCVWYRADLRDHPIRAANAKFARETEEEMLARIKRIRRGDSLSVNQSQHNNRISVATNNQPAECPRDGDQVELSSVSTSHSSLASFASSFLDRTREAEREVMHAQVDERIAEREADHSASIDRMEELKQPLSPQPQPNGHSFNQAIERPVNPPADPDSVSLMIHEMQFEHWRDQNDNQSNNQSNSQHKPTTRVADWKNPRLTGRALIMQPPAVTKEQLDVLRQQKVKDKSNKPFKRSRRINKLLIFFLILLGTIGAFAGGVNLGWAACGGAVAMLIADWRDPDVTISQVDWSLLVFFSSLFVVTAGFNATELPADAWNAVESYIDVDTALGLLVYSVIIVIGSNTVSNVPLVLLLGPSIPKLGDPRTAWLLLSYVSTVAGNLTLVGSVANLIVCARAKHFYTLEFYEYLRFGFPTTLLTTVVGVLVVRGLSAV